MIVTIIAPMAIIIKINNDIDIDIKIFRYGCEGDRISLHIDHVLRMAFSRLDFYSDIISRCHPTLKHKGTYH